MIPIDDVLTGVWTWLNDDATLRTICGAAGRIVKGAKRPDGLANPSITVQLPARSHVVDWAGAQTMTRTSRESMLVTSFSDLNDVGTADVPQLSTMAARIHTLAATSRPTITGGVASRLGAYSESGPVYDPQDQHEAYYVTQLGLWVRDAS